MLWPPDGAGHPGVERRASVADMKATGAAAGFERVSHGFSLGAKGGMEMSFVSKGT